MCLLDTNKAIYLLAPEQNGRLASTCETIRQRSMSLLLLPKPFRDEPTINRPQSNRQNNTTQVQACQHCEMENRKWKIGRKIFTQAKNYKKIVNSMKNQ